MADEHGWGDLHRAATTDLSTGINLAPSNSTSLPCDVKDVFRLAVCSEWYVVYAFTDASGQAKQWTREAAFPTALTPAPVNARTVIVLAEPESYQPAEELVAELAEVGARQRRLQQPIVVMLLAKHGVTSNEAILRAQASLQDAGADDVCLKPNAGSDSLCDFRMTIESATLRARSKLATLWSLVEQANEQEGRIRNLQHTLWRHVRACLPDCPPVDFEGPEELEPGSQIKQYTLHQVIGKGRMCTVHAAKNQHTGQTEVIKVVPKDTLNSIEDVQEVLSEVSVLRKLDHKNIVHFIDLTHTRNFLLVHMDLAGSRPLFRFMIESGGRLSEEMTRALTSQIAQALAHCHERGVVHCDVKPENIIVSQDGSRAKLVDFGLAVAAGNACSGMRGTMPFLAPEMFSEAPYDPAPIDMWAIGVLVLELLCGLGKLNKMMHWRRDVAPSPRLQGELERFFSHPEVVLDSVKADGVPPSPLRDHVLCSTLAVVPATRCTSAELATAGWLSEVVLE
jgi:hypothetical protein